MTTGLQFKLCMTDTDSFLFKVSNVKKFYKKFKNHMDFSNYPINHKYFSVDRKQMLGYFKDEFAGTHKCLEFVGLRSKCYALKLEEIDSRILSDKKVAKGIGRSAIKTDMKFEHYKKCLLEHVCFRNQFHTIRSLKHQIKTVLINKLSLSYIDTKRWLFDCSVHSAPYGSYLIKKYKSKCPVCKLK